MKAEAFKQFFSNIGDECKKNSPALLIFAGIASMAATMIMVNRVAPKAKIVLDEIHDRRDTDETRPEVITARDKALDIWNDFKAVAPFYAPAAVTFIVGSACIIGSYKISTKRLTAITTAYGIAENRLQEYQKKVIEKIGPEKEQEIRDEIAEKHMKEVEEKEGLPELHDGLELWYDDMSKRYFRASLQDIYDAKEHVNVTLQGSPVKLNEFYCVLGLEEVEAMDIYEWPEGGRLDIRFGSHICKDGITSCTALFYDVPVGGDYYTRY